MRDNINIIIKIILSIFVCILCVYTCFNFIIECTLSIGYQSALTKVSSLLESIVTHFTGGLCCIYTIKKTLEYVKTLISSIKT